MEMNLDTNDKYEKVVFVSYAWGDESEDVVNGLEKAFAEHGINIVRDKKDLNYRGSIKEFEQRIGMGQCIILVISDKYLRSPHCMYEIAEIEENKNFRKRIFPVILKDANIFDTIARVEYINFWDEKIKELNQAIKGIDIMTGVNSFTEDLNDYGRIRHKFDTLTNVLRDMNTLTPEIHAASGYGKLIDAIKSELSEEYEKKATKEDETRIHAGSSTDKFLMDYLNYVIDENSPLHLKGILLDTESVRANIKDIYVGLRVSYKPNDGGNDSGVQLSDKSSNVQRGGIIQVFSEYPYWVLLGESGLGKTTFLHYTAYCYADDMHNGSQDDAEKEKIRFDDRLRLPMIFDLKDVEKYLINDKNIKGYTALIDYLMKTTKNYIASLPVGFFDLYLEKGKGILLFDGLDEIRLERGRVVDMIKSLKRKYPGCYFIVTSRPYAHEGISRLDDTLEFEVATLQRFAMEDIGEFLEKWNLPKEDIMQEIKGDQGLWEISTNPLLLTIIALTYRERFNDNRRTRVYDRLLSILLEKLDRGKGVNTYGTEDYPLTSQDIKNILQKLALKMIENVGSRNEISRPVLEKFLNEEISLAINNGLSGLEKKQVIEKFYKAMVERAGILNIKEESFSFSHFSFQEYLAARAIASSPNYKNHALQRLNDPSWKEIIILESGCLKIEKSLRLIKSIANSRSESLPFQNLILAAECLIEVGLEHSEISDLRQEINTRLLRALQETSFLQKILSILNAKNTRTLISQRSKVAQVLLRSGFDNKYWHNRFGEPKWISIPFKKQQPGDRFQISPTPITNLQYLMFVQDTKRLSFPQNWVGDRPPVGKESHPVVLVSQLDALEYCHWLSQKIKRQVTLPSKEEWREAAQGHHIQEYPWGKWKGVYANTKALEIGDTTPVGIFPEASSPYGVLDMIGNVWEWTRDFVEDDPSTIFMCGGSFTSSPEEAKIGNYIMNDSGVGLKDGGFRVVICS